MLDIIIQWKEIIISSSMRNGQNLIRFPPPPSPFKSAAFGDPENPFSEVLNNMWLNATTPLDPQLSSFKHAQHNCA